MKIPEIKMNYRECYEVGKKELEEAGIAEASLDARLLLEFVCSTGRHDLLAHGDRPVTEEKSARYLSAVKRRKMHEPLQYIIGEQEFMGLLFTVSGHVLIPRQDTEVLLEEVLHYLHNGMEILDMCTGSGCILLSLLHFSENCKGTGADISALALSIARENAYRLKEVNAEFVQSDLFENINKKYDLIVSNPPYINSDDIPGLMEEVKDYEPMEALDGHEDGLFFYEKIIGQASEYLKNGGLLFFEIGCSQAEAVSGMMSAAGYKNISVIKDLAGLDRVVYGSRADGRKV